MLLVAIVPCCTSYSDTGFEVKYVNMWKSHRLLLQKHYKTDIQIEAGAIFQYFLFFRDTILLLKKGCEIHIPLINHL